MSSTITNPQQSAYGLAILRGLGDPRKHVYGGTVPAATVARRRAKNRVARRSRAVNRAH
ncbi:hypothetical protein ACWEF6_02930 [Amycolatopsis sp. NPDC004772]